MFWLNLTEYARKRNQEMDWNSKILRTTPFISRPSQIFTNFLCNSNFDSFQGLETKQDGQVNLMMAPINPQESEIMTTSYGGQEKRIRRLTTDQLESLECSFQAERKLEPSRKIKLANELGLQPRQVAVWFQNRRARWKAKKIEHLYDALKEDYALVSSEKHKLQEEVVRLKSMVMELSNRKKVVSIGSKETYGDETEECSQSTMVAIRRSSNNMLGEGSSKVGVSNFDQHYQGNYLFNNVNDFASMPPPYRGAYT